MHPTASPATRAANAVHVAEFVGWLAEHRAAASRPAPDGFEGRATADVLAIVGAREVTGIDRIRYRTGFGRRAWGRVHFSDGGVRETEVD